MLIWTKRIRGSQKDQPIRVRYETDLPGWGRACVHSYVHAPGEMFLTCDSLGIELHSLGEIAPEDAIKPAEAELERMLIQYVTWCAEALTAIHSGDTGQTT